MTKDTPTDSQADDWIDDVLKKLIVNTHDQASDTEAMRPDQVTHFTNYKEFFESAKAAIKTKLAEAEKAAYEAGYNTRTLEADHEIEDAVRDAHIKVEKAQRKRLEVAKSMVVKYSNEHEALGIGWVISGIDRMAYDAGQRITKLQHRQALNERSE